MDLVVEGMKLSKNQDKKPTNHQRPSKSGKDPKSTLARRKWLPAAIAGVTLIGAGFAFTSEPVLAAVNSAVVTARMANGHTEFEQKEAVLENKSIQTESDKAFGGISAKWTDNSVDDVKAEIARQKEAGLPVYVIQWGDTLSVLAKALDKSVDDLAKTNNLENDDLILTGDVLLGVLSTSVVPSNETADVDKQEDAPVDVDKKAETPNNKDENVDAPSVAKDEDEDAATTVVPNEDVEAPIVEVPKDEPTILPIDPMDDDAVVPADEPTVPITPVDVDKEPEANPDPADLPDDMIVEKPLGDNPDGINDPLDKPAVVDDKPTVIPVEPVDDSVGDDVDKDIIVEQDVTSITYDAMTTIKRGIKYVSDDSLKPDETKVVSEGKDGLITQSHLYGAYSDGEIVHDLVGDEKRIEPEDQVIHFGPTEKEYDNQDPVEINSGRKLTELDVVGAVQSNVFSYFVESDLRERLTASGYSLESDGESLVVLTNPDDINADPSEDLQLKFAYNGTDKPLDYKLVDQSNTSKQAKQVLSAVEKLNKLFDASQSKHINAEAKGIELNAIVLTLVEWSFMDQDKSTMNDINTEYQTFMKNMELLVAERMTQLENQ